MVFSSAHQLQFMMTSRRDDLISLCYLLVFLVNKGNIPGVKIYNQSENRHDTFIEIRDAKVAHDIEELCNEKLGTEDLEDFVREIFSYRFKDKPRYGVLREILVSLIELEDDEVEVNSPPQEEKKASDDKPVHNTAHHFVKDIMTDLNKNTQPLSQKVNERTATFGSKFKEMKVLGVSNSS